MKNSMGNPIADHMVRQKVGAAHRLLLSEDNQTMVPKIIGFLGTTQQPGQVMYAVAATVSVILPLLVLVLFSQRRIVGGLVAGAVKG